MSEHGIRFKSFEHQGGGWSLKYEKYPDRESRDAALKMMAARQEPVAVDFEPGTIVSRTGGLSWTLEDAIADSLGDSLSYGSDDNDVDRLRRRIDAVAELLGKVIDAQPSLRSLGVEALSGRFRVIP